MHNLLQRATTVTSRFSTGVAFVAVAVSLLGTLQLYLAGGFALQASVPAVSAKVHIHTTRWAGSPNGKPKENARLKLDLEADLEPLFNWNTKQVFVYLTADYAGSRPDIQNSVTLWDKIVKTKDDAHISIRQKFSKYAVWDVQDSFDGRNASLTLRWSLQPNVGFMLHGSMETLDNLGKPASFVFPGSEEKKAEKKRAEKRKRLEEIKANARAASLKREAERAAEAEGDE